MTPAFGLRRSAREPRAQPTKPEHVHVGSGRNQAKPGGLGARASRVPRTSNLSPLPSNRRPLRNDEASSVSTRRDLMKRIRLALIASLFASLVASATFAGTPRID